MTHLCPCCGQPLSDPPLQAFNFVLNKSGRRIIELIAQRPGASRRDLADKFYEEDPDGGPDWAENNISNMISRANKKIAPLGWRIKSNTGMGGGYWLEKL